MDNTHRQVDFFHSFLEKQAQFLLQDSKARLTKMPSGRVLLDVDKGLLANLFHQLREQKKYAMVARSQVEWLQEDLAFQRTKAEKLHKKLDDMETQLLDKRSEALSEAIELMDKLSNMEKQLQNKDPAESQARSKAQRLEKDLASERARAQELQDKLSNMEKQLQNKDVAESQARSNAQRLEKDLASERARAQRLQALLSAMKEHPLAKQATEFEALTQAQLGDMKTQLLDQRSKALSEAIELMNKVSNMEKQLLNKDAAESQARSKARRLEKHLACERARAQKLQERLSRISPICENLQYQLLKQRSDALLEAIEQMDELKDMEKQLLNKDAAEAEARSKAQQLEEDLASERTRAQKLQEQLSDMKEQLLAKQATESEAPSQAPRLEKDLASERARAQKLQEQLSDMKEQLLAKQATESEAPSQAPRLEWLLSQSALPMQKRLETLRLIHKFSGWNDS